MGETRDCREDVLNSLISWAISHGIDSTEAKYDFYMLLNNVEITSRCTEIAQIEENRNEYLLKKFLIAKKVKGCTDRTLNYYGQSIQTILNKIGKTVDDITADDGFIVLVEFDLQAYKRRTSSAAVKRTVSLPAWLASESESRGYSYSQVLQEALLQKIGG